MSDPKDVFESIYANNVWGNKESLSGPGSTVKVTEILRPRLEWLLRLLNIKSILDVPCGDMNYMQHIDLSGIHYLGADIVEELVNKNNEACKDRPNMRFQVLNVLEDPLPEAELIICRDLLVHFPNDAALQFLHKVKNSRSRYILMTHFMGDYAEKERNKEIKFGFWRPVSLTQAPFNWPHPFLSIPEKEQYKTLSLWRIEDF